MSFFESISTCLIKKYFDFSGRATCSEFWWFYLFRILFFIGSSFLVMIVVNVLDSEFVIYLWFLLQVFLIIPCLSACVRRLHDAGYSGWSFLLGFIPVVGPFILLVMLTSETSEIK